MANLIKSWRSDWFAARSQGYLRSVKTKLNQVLKICTFLIDMLSRHGLTLHNQLPAPSMLDQLGMLAK